MACTTLTGIPYGCNDDIGVGGIRRAFVFDMLDIETETLDNTTLTVSALDLQPGDSAKEFVFKRNTANHVSSPAIDLINGSTYFTDTVTLMFSKRMASKSVALQLLGEGQRYLGVVYQDANGYWWYTRDLQLTGGDETSGQAKADNSKYEVVLTGENLTRTHSISEALALALLVPAS